MADDTALATITFLPEVVIEHHNFIGFRLVLLGQKRTAQSRLDAEHRKKIGSHAIRFNLFRFAVSCQVEAAFVECGRFLKHLVLGFPIRKVGLRRSVARKTRERSIFPKHHQTIRVRKRQSTQQYGVDNTENCSVRTDTSASVITAMAVKPGRFKRFLAP